jgi:metallo-beta-lactamase family protein
MRVTFWGAARTVTGSKHLVTGRSGSILLDCGLFQGRRAESEARNRALPFAAAAVDAVVLSHVHIDHSGALPLLCKSGFEGPIHATRTTADLCGVMLADAAHIQMKDVEWLNRRRHGEHGRPIEPLYDLDDVARVLTRLVPHEYDQPFEPVAGLETAFHDAGHIAGSASISLRWRQNGSGSSLVFTGDMGRSGRAILRDPKPLPTADYLITEGTYGGKRHPGEAELWTSLEAVVREALDRGGRIVIPAFALGRTQDIVYALDQLFRAGRLPEIPIFVDSPLAADVQSIVRGHPEVFDDDTAAAIRRGDDPLGLTRVTLVREAADSMRLNDKPGTFITVSASGMCEGGRILHHLKHTIEDARNTVVIIGYQADGTLGRRLVEGAPEVRIFGEPHEVHAKIVVLNGFSAHADHDHLIEQAVSCGARKGIAIVHADPERAEALRGGLPRKDQARIPNEGDTWELR